jgi:hypothetical protein
MSQVPRPWQTVSTPEKETTSQHPLTRRSASITGLPSLSGPLPGRSLSFLASFVQRDYVYNEIRLCVCDRRYPSHAISCTNLTHPADPLAAQDSGRRKPACAWLCFVARAPACLVLNIEARVPCFDTMSDSMCDHFGQNVMLVS